MKQEKYDIFISYSRKDYVDNDGNVIPGNEVSKIMDALSEAGITFWFDKEGVIHGEDFGEKILKYIKSSKIFVYLSTTAANESEWTRKEIASAVMYKKKIIPVRIDESPYHDSVMFRIADLDYINYSSNPQKGRLELVESVLRYKAEEQAAAERREVEEKRRREEQERQYKQQEYLRRRQQQADELRLEISKTEDECSKLEKTLLLKQHDLGVVNLELESKRKHLEEQKQQMNAILFTEDTPAAEKTEEVTSQMQPIEDVVFEFHWKHFSESMRNMWQKIKETMRLRHIVVNVVLCLIVCFFMMVLVGGLGMLFSKEVSGLQIFASFILPLYALWQLLLNKRSGVALLLISPILLMYILYLLRYVFVYTYRIFIYHGSISDILINFFISYFVVVGLVLSLLLIRKNGRNAWSLLEGKFIFGLQIHRYVGYYTMFMICLFLAFFQLESEVNDFSNKAEEELQELKEDRERVDSIESNYHEIVEELETTQKELEVKKKELDLLNKQVSRTKVRLNFPER